MMLIDTHCHLYSKNFDADLPQVVERAVNNEVLKIFLPAIDTESHERLHKLADTKFNTANPGFEILPMMGVHPCSIKEGFEAELAAALTYLNGGRKYYAVGEIGLDYYWDLTFKAQQIMAFEKQIEWAVERNLPVVIHSRESTGDCIKSVKKFEGRVKGIFHCFSGTIEEAKQIAALGMYMGIGGVVTYKKAGLKEILPQIGIENVVLETDAPYLPPAPHRGKRNEPSYTRIVAETVAEAFGLTLEKAAEITTANALRVFQMNS
ncbi:MAG TPA: TatD family hydrolase [Chitinophagales bacterium]|nr:TatD family hydrolase [Chitinophagales bacterium]